ncbi:MAG: hypothetical protein WCA63_11620 [Gallionella sp.]
MPRIKLTREFISSYLKEVIPDYEEMLVFIEKNGGWISPPPKFSELVDKLKIHDYPFLYRGEETIVKALLLSFMPVEEINKLGAELESIPENEKAQFTEELIKSISESADEVFDSYPDNPEKEQAAQKVFSDLSPEEQNKAIKQAQLMLSVFLAMFYNSVSMMVHGRKLTDLVRSAEGGDDDAFCLAVQIDKRILLALPYFKERYDKAIVNGEVYFQDKLHYRVTSPLLRSKIRYKTLWLTFAVLDDSGLMDGYLKHREILDICDEVGVGGYENRIEDVVYLTKRIREYRKFQNINQR